MFAISKARNSGGRMASHAYTRKGQWSEVTIRQTKWGWSVRHTCRIQGETTGWIVSLPFGGDFPRDLDLNLNWNDYMDNFAALLDRADICRRDREALRYYHAHVVSRGYTVE